MATTFNYISNQWIREIRDDFRAFLYETNFYDSQRPSVPGPKSTYFEWLIMFIGGFMMEGNRNPFYDILIGA
jgi:hypothetical protein